MKKKSILSVIPQALLFAIIIGFVTFFLNDKLGLSNYEANTKILVTDTKEVNSETNLAAAYAATIDSNEVKNEVIKNLGLDMTLGELDKELKVNPIEASPIINVTVEDPIKLRAEDIADEFADVAVKRIKDVFGTETKVIEYSYGQAGVKSNKEKNAVMFGGCAFVVWFVFGSLFTLIANIGRKDEDIVTEEKVEVEEEPQQATGKYKKVADLPKYDDEDLDD